MRYRKRPVEVEAMLVAGPYKTVAEWSGARIIRGERNEIVFLLVKTLEGNMKAVPGDWIIKGVAGEFYPRKPDIFEATYEEIEDQV